MSDLMELVDQLDLVVVRADQIAPKETIRKAAGVAAAVRQRWALLTDRVVVALVGGTGSGKSSLLNALAGRDIASVSAFRPHTDEALAWRPADDPVLERILVDLGIERVVDNETMPSLAILDLPDMDSVVSWHRAIVEDLLPRVDVIVWVTDPVKYNDPVVHREFLTPLVPYEDRLVFVLNKVDQVSDADRDTLMAHYREVLERDGYREPPVLPTAAPSEEAARFGIDDLARFLTSKIDAKRVIVDKLALDLARTAREMAEGLGTWERTGLLPEDRSGRDLRHRVGEHLELLRRTADPMTARLVSVDAVDVDAVAEHLTRRAELGAALASVYVEALRFRAERAQGA